MVLRVNPKITSVQNTPFHVMAVGDTQFVMSILGLIVQAFIPLYLLALMIFNRNEIISSYLRYAAYMHHLFGMLAGLMTMAIYIVQSIMSEEAEFHETYSCWSKWTAYNQRSLFLSGLILFGLEMKFVRHTFWDGICATLDIIVWVCSLYKIILFLVYTSECAYKSIFFFTRIYFVFYIVNNNNHMFMANNLCNMYSL